MAQLWYIFYQAVVFQPPTVNRNWEIAWTKLSRKRTKSETSKIAKITFFSENFKNNLARHSFGMYSIQLWCFKVQNFKNRQNYIFSKNVKNNLARHSFGIYSIQLWSFIHLQWTVTEISPGQTHLDGRTDKRTRCVSISPAPAREAGDKNAYTYIDAYTGVHLTVYPKQQKVQKARITLHVCSHIGIKMLTNITDVYYLEWKYKCYTTDCIEKLIESSWT